MFDLLYDANHKISRSHACSQPNSVWDPEQPSQKNKVVKLPVISQATVDFLKDSISTYALRNLAQSTNFSRVK